MLQHVVDLFKLCFCSRINAVNASMQSELGTLFKRLASVQSDVDNFNVTAGVVLR